MIRVSHLDETRRPPDYLLVLFFACGAILLVSRPALVGPCRLDISVSALSLWLLFPSPHDYSIPP